MLFGRTTRRGFLGSGLALGAGLALSGQARAKQAYLRRPVIDCTDLYHPHQDVGDNLDIIAAYGLPEVDLRAIVLDVTERFRHDIPREPGFIPVAQLNWVFRRNVPCGATPFQPMRDPEDKMLDASPLEQAGVSLLLETLRRSRGKVDIVSFGSAKPVAIAYNRAPHLMRAKVRLVHLCAGSSEPPFIEWNVELDRAAFIRVLRSDLPVAIYPCATGESPFALGKHNSYYLLENLDFVRDMAPQLRQYLTYAFTASSRLDFLRFLDEEAPEAVLNEVCHRPHNVWETAVWAQVADRRIVQRADGRHALVPAREVRDDDRVLPNELIPCRVSVDDSATMTWEPCDGPTDKWMYDRGDPAANQAALREALPALYRSFVP